MNNPESNVPRDNCISLPVIKRNLRTELISRRSAMSLAQHATASAIIVSRLVQMLANIQGSGEAIRVGLYWPIKNEIDTRGLVNQLTTTRNGEAIQWALPAIETDSNTIIYGAWQPHEAVIEGALGIMQPVVFNQVEVDVMLVPCVGFNDQGYRIGYGGGYFDRTLATKKALTIGVAFELCRCNWTPQDHDRPLQTIITERTILQPNT
jgi:5-formyltetrahydrofolate cyclo-ligase